MDVVSQHHQLGFVSSEFVSGTHRTEKLIFAPAGMKTGVLPHHHYVVFVSSEFVSGRTGRKSMFEWCNSSLALEGNSL